MTARRAERIMAFCLDKISRRCDFRGDGPVRTTGYTDDFGDNCDDLGLPRALSTGRTHSPVRSSPPSAMENEHNSLGQAQLSQHSFREGESSPVTRRVYVGNRRMDPQPFARKRYTEVECTASSSSPLIASQPTTHTERRAAKRRRTEKVSDAHRSSRLGRQGRRGMAVAQDGSETTGTTRNAKKRKSRRPIIEDEDEDEDGDEMEGDEMEEEEHDVNEDGSQDECDSEDPYLSPEDGKSYRLQERAHDVDGITTEEDE